MLEVLIPQNPEFKKYEAQVKELYEQSQSSICDTNTFEFVCNNTFFYTFLTSGKLLGAIYYFLDEDKLFLNGFAIRKEFESNLEALRLSTGWFSCDIYAEAQNRASAICLLRCGFKRIKENLFCLSKGNH